MQILWEGRGKHFDPELVDLFVTYVDEVVEIQNRFVSREKAQETIDVILLP
jgi:response regulator RpfG family c-di-GMP phosphodiesterase